MTIYKMSKIFANHIFVRETYTKQIRMLNNSMARKQITRLKKGKESEESFHKIRHKRWALVAHACNPNYLKG
jgi:hypothetical protein